MSVIIWAINYAPEVTGIAPYNVKLAEFLHSRGEVVEIITTFPYYPAWRKRAEDRGYLFRTEVLGGVIVRRCWHYVPGKVSAFKRVVHEASFVFSSFLRLLSLSRADLLIVISPPLLLGAAAWVLRKVKGTPFIFHVQDLQPDAAVGLGMLKPGAFTRALYGLEGLAYSKAARVSGISLGMLDVFRRKGVPEAKLVYFPNAVRLPDPGSFPTRGSFRRRHGVPTNEFLAVYSGNLGVKQGIDVLFDAARLLPEGIRIVICGDGARRQHLQSLLISESLQNVLMLPLLELDEYFEMLVDADVCLITQQRGSGKAFFPSKLLPTLAYGRPVISVSDIDSELFRAICVGGFGVNVLPDDAVKLANALKDLQARPAELEAYGQAGRRYVEQFEEKSVLQGILDAMSKVVSE